MEYKLADTTKVKIDENDYKALKEKQKDNNSIKATIVWLLITVETLLVSNIFSLNMFIGEALTGKMALTLMLIIFAALELIFSPIIIIKRNKSGFLETLAKRTIIIEAVIGSMLIITMPFMLIK